MKKHLKTFIFFILAFTFSFLAFNSSHAAAIVPCGPGTAKSSCGLCDFITLAKNVVNFILAFAAVLAVVYLLYGGFLILTSAGNSKRVEEGKASIRNAVIGMVILFGSWLIVDTTLRIFIGSTSPTDWGPWNTFPQCQELNTIIYGNPQGQQ